MHRLAVVATVLLFVPLASAEAEPLDVDRVDAHGALTQSGALEALSLRQWGGAPALQNVSLQAAQLVVYEFVRSGVHITPGACVPEAPRPACEGLAVQTSPDIDRTRYPTSGTLRGAALEGAAGGNLTFNAFPFGDARVVAKAGDLTSYSLSDACLSPRGIQDPPDPCTGGYDAAENLMSIIPLDDPSVVTNGTEGATLQVVGDFIVEVEGLALASRDEEHAWWSGDRFEGDIAGTYENRWLRLVVQGGVLRLAYGPGLGESEWVLSDGQTEALQSTLTLHGARGVLDLGDGPRTLEGGTEQLRGDFLYSTDPGDDSLAVAVAPAAVAQETSAAEAIGGSPWVWAALAVVVAIGALVAWRQRRVRMEHVEAALEEGRYGRAARLAARLLRRDPFHESAMLGRAIAWERAGRPGRVVPAVQQYLQEREPHDGALHFVLGLAYLDLGDEQSAKDALAEATRRTPALLDEITPELRPRPAGGVGYS